MGTQPAQAARPCPWALKQALTWGWEQGGPALVIAALCAVCPRVTQPRQAVTPCVAAGGPRGPTGACRHRRDGSALRHVCPRHLHGVLPCPPGGSSPAHTRCPRAPTLCGIEGPVGGGEARAVEARARPGEYGQLVARGEETRGQPVSAEPAQREQRPSALGTAPAAHGRPSELGPRAMPEGTGGKPSGPWNSGCERETHVLSGRSANQPLDLQSLCGGRARKGAQEGLAKRRAGEGSGRNEALEVRGDTPLSG